MRLTDECMELIWNHDDPISELTMAGRNPGVPRWIDQDITPATVAAILQGGCNSGAYMPAVTYHLALSTMQQHGDSEDGVLQYLEDNLGEIPTPPAGVDALSWGGLACMYVSTAVELWAASVEDELLLAFTTIEL